MNEVTVDEIIEDIKRRNYYWFSIKPKDEDEQYYSPPVKRSVHWAMAAFCFIGKIKTLDLLHRLESRRDAEVTKIEKNWSQLIFTEGTSRNEEQESC